MKTKTFNASTKAMAFGVFAIFLMSAISAATVYSEDFSDGVLSGWTITNTGTINSEWTTVADATDYLLRANPGKDDSRAVSSAITVVDTSGYQGIQVAFNAPTGGGLEGNDYFNASYFNGTDFVTLGNGQLPSEGTNTGNYFGPFTLPAIANDNPNLQLKFECSTNAADEHCDLDNIVVTGTVIPVSELSVSSAVISPEADSVNVTVTNTGNTPVSDVVLAKESGDFEVTIEPSTIEGLDAGESATVTVTMTTSESSLKIGPNSVILTATSAQDTSASGTVDFERSFCELGPQNDTTLEFEVTINNKGEGTDSEWRLLDTIEVEVEIDNKGVVDVQDIIFELGLFEKDSSVNIADDLIWLSDEDESFKFGDIDEDEDGKHVFEFRVNPDKLDDGDYVLVVKAYSDGDEDKVCIDASSSLADSDFGSASESFAEIRIDNENDKGKMVVVDTYPLSGLTALCGQDFSIFADVYNIGDEDFEDQVKVTLFNKELGISVEDVLIGDLDAGDKSRANFAFTVPQNASNRVYWLSLVTEYDYDEDDDDYDEVSEEVFRVQLNIQGCTAASDVLISASLGSDAVSGDEMEVNVVLTNTQDTLRTFTVEVAGYQTWAELSESPSALTIGAQSASETIVKFNVKEDISGEQPFTLRIFEDGTLIATQSVSVNIEPKSSFGFTGFAIGGDNAYLWGMGLLNVILLVVIIVVAVRFARK